MKRLDPDTLIMPEGYTLDGAAEPLVDVDTVVIVKRFYTSRHTHKEMAMVQFVGSSVSFSVRVEDMKVTP